MRKEWKCELSPVLVKVKCMIYLTADIIHISIYSLHMQLFIEDIGCCVQESNIHLHS